MSHLDSASKGGHLVRLGIGKPFLKGKVGSDPEMGREQRA